MRFSTSMNVPLFLREVSLCDGRVELCTAQGDVLNLKSELSKYLFAVLMTMPDTLHDAWIVCDLESDIHKIENFLSE